MKHTVTWLAVGACTLLGIQQAGALTIGTTIRDFVNPGIPGYAAHPDFEGDIGGLQKGAVKSTLGVDGKPVWNVAKPGFTTEANFNQWYNDAPGVNTKMAYDLVLTAKPGGIYEYVSSSFFPIDGLLLGDQGRSHNYHFTLELHSSFTYQPGQTFSFTGDDDLWLFIDDQLVVDLGGVHSEVSESLNLDTLGLLAGTDYSFDLFFAERHTSESNFKMQTAGIQFKPTPEAVSTLGLVGLAFAGLGLLRRKV